MDITKSPINEIRNLFKSISVNVIATILTALIAVGTTAFMARILPLEDFGRIIILLTLINAFAIFEGLRPVIIHRVGNKFGQSYNLFKSSAQINTWMSIFTLTLLAIVESMGFGESLPNSTKAVIALTSITFFACMQYYTFLDAEQDTIFTGLSRSACWIFLYLSFSIITYLKLDLFFYSICILIMHILWLFSLVIRFQFLDLHRKYIRATERDEKNVGLFKVALSNIIFNVSAVTINLADRAIVGAFFGGRMVGLYAGPSELALRANGLVRSAIQVALPWAANVPAEIRKRYWLTVAIATLIVTCTFTATLLLQRDAVTQIIFGPRFYEAADLFGIFVTGVMISTVGYICIIEFNARGDFTTQRVAYSIAAIGMVCGAMLGALNQNLTYVAISYLAARSIDIILFYLLLKSYPTKLKIWFIPFFSSILLSLISAWCLEYIFTTIFLTTTYGLVFFAYQKKLFRSL